MDALEFMMEDMKVAPHLRVDVRSYFKQTRWLQKRRAYNSLASQLSPKIEGELRIQMNKRIVSNVWWLSQCDPIFLGELLMHF